MRSAALGWIGPLLALGALAVGLSGCSAPAPSQPTVPAVPALTAHRLVGATCRILADSWQQADGAGVLVDAAHGIVLTAASVVRDRTRLRVAVDGKEPGSARVAFHDPVRELAWLRLEQLPSGTESLAVAVEHTFRPGEMLYSVAGGSAAGWNSQAGQLRQVLQPPHY